MSRPPRWGVSALDYHTHALDEDAVHPGAVYVARRGQPLFKGATLYDEPPPGGDRTCLSCPRPTEREDTGEVTEPPPATCQPGRWARSPLDHRAHLPLPEGEHPSGVLTTHCGARMTTSVTQHEQPLPGLNCEYRHLIFLADSPPRDEESPAGRRLSHCPRISSRRPCRPTPRGKGLPA